MPVYPQVLARKNPETTLYGQFIVAKSESHIPRDWKRIEHPPWVLGVHPKLAVAEFDIPAIKTSGWLLGYAIDPVHMCFGLSSNALETVSEYDGYLGIESIINGLSGRFAVVTFAPASSRLYLDAAGQLSAVYSKEKEIAASSPMLIPYDSMTQDDRELIEEMEIPETNAFFSFGMTPRRSVKRLLPNHYLDLERWKPIRHWPLEEIAITSCPESAVTEIGEIIQRTIAVVCEKYTPYLSLTAGRDSRILLACAKELTNKIRFFTWDMPDETAKADIRIAKGLAKTYELLHQVFPFLDSSEADKDQWLFRTGVAVGEIRGLSLATTIKLMDESQPYLPGLASEVGRAFYWQPGDNEKAAMSAEEVVRRLGLPQSERIIAEAKKWLHDLPFTKPYDILDFAYIEQRLGCWAGVTAYGDVEGPIRIPPFSNRRIFALMLSLPYEFRQQQRLAEILIDRMWPDLLRTPFNPVTLRTKIKRRLSKTPFCWRLSRWL